ncbi:hypothetical protein OKW29_005149 [Paraburkholderia sp. CI3]
MMVNPFATFFRFLDRRTLQHARRLSFRYGIFWLGAVATGLVAVLYAHLNDAGYDIFRRITAVRWWLPFLLTPAIGAASVWITRRFIPGAKGSGIPQVIATLHDRGGLAPRLLSIRILIGKIVVSFLSIVGGFTIGREGPTIHVGAALMFNLRHFYPARFRAIRGFDLERRLALAGAAAGLSAAFICGSVNATVGDRIAEDLMPPDSSGPWAGMRLSSGSCAAAVACPMARWYADRAEPPSGSSSANLWSEANGESLTAAEEHFKSRTSFGAGSFALSALGFAASRINW